MSLTSLPRVSPLLLPLLAAALAAGAAAPLHAGDDADAQARRLYRSKCSGCHRLHPKDEFSAAEWKKKLPEMGKRAKLTPEQFAIISRFLGVAEDEPAAAAQAPAPTPMPSHGATTK